MTIPLRLKTYLEQAKIPYSLITHIPTYTAQGTASVMHIPGKEVAKTETAVSPRISLKNILYAADFSPYSDAALPFALSLASRYHSAIFAVHIISVSPFPKSNPTHTLQAIAAQCFAR